MRRERDRLRRRVDGPSGAQPRGGAGNAGGGSHGGDPRHLRLPRRERRGQAPGRARPARVQPRAHARAVEPPRAPRRRHRHEGSGGDADRDRSPPRARPHRGAAQAPRAREGNTGGAARRARAGGAADDRSGRLHQRGQVDPAERAHRRRGGGARPSLPHARPDHAHAQAGRQAISAYGHGRFHQQAPAPAHRRVRGDPRGDHAARSCSPTCSTARLGRSSER